MATTDVSPCLCVTEARAMQSCSSSSLGRWSMDVLMGSMERGFFFFSRSEDKQTFVQKQAEDEFQRF